MDRQQHDGRREIAHQGVLDAGRDVDDTHAAEADEEQRATPVAQREMCDEHVQHGPGAHEEHAVDDVVGVERRDPVTPEEPPQPHGAVEPSKGVAVRELAERPVARGQLGHAIDEEGGLAVSDAGGDPGESRRDAERQHPDDDRGGSQPPALARPRHAPERIVGGRCRDPRGDPDEQQAGDPERQGGGRVVEAQRVGIREHRRAVHGHEPRQDEDATGPCHADRKRGGPPRQPSHHRGAARRPARRPRVARPARRPARRPRAGQS